jgi:peptide/nickel transport system permease protein
MTRPASAADPAPVQPAAPGPANEQVSVASQWQLMRWRFTRHKAAVIALVVLGVMYLVAAFADFVGPYDPRSHDAAFVYAPPTGIHFVDEEGRFHLRPFVYPYHSELILAEFRTVYSEDRSRMVPIRLFARGDSYVLWGLFETDLHLFGLDDPEARIFLFGTDRLGRDLFTRILIGSRISLTIGLVGIAVTFVLGIVIGGISGYFGGAVDLVIQRVIEFVQSLPTLPLWMGLSAALPKWWSMTMRYFAIVVILSLIDWTGLARVVRGKFMALREEDYVAAARLNGASRKRIIFRHLLPGFLSHIIASLTLSIPAMILGESALSFIGLGLQAPAISWGVLLAEAQKTHVLALSPWLLIPGLFIIVVVLAFNFVGDGVRDAADPYAHV